VHPLSLSTAWNSFRHKEGESLLLEIRDLGFTHAELSHGIRFSLWPGILKAVEAGIVKISSLHNFCPVPMGVLSPSPNCYTFSDPRPAIRHAAVQATQETIRNAAKLGAGAVVLHLGWAGPDGITRELERLYRAGNFLNRRYVAAKVRAVGQRQALFSKTWSRVKECLEPLAELAAEKNIRLGFECRERFEEFPLETEFDSVLDSWPSAVAGYWHDFGHSARKDFLGWHTHAETLARLAPRLIGCHIHDCRAPHHDHLPLGHGEIDFPSLMPLLPPEIIPVLELSPKTSPEQVLASRNLWQKLSSPPALSSAS
jgi:sugar phosphate isomerase/epimerase